MKKIVKKILRRPHKIIPTNPHINTEETERTNPTGIGCLQRPWHRIGNTAEPETVFILAKRNYKVYANLGLTSSNMKRFTTILDTGAGSSFIRLDEIPHPMRNHITPTREEVTIRNASGKPVPILGTIRLSVQVGRKTEKVDFLVAEKLATAVILGCDYCDKYVECIKPRLRLVELDDGSTVPIVRQSSRTQAQALLPEEQQDPKRVTRTSPKIKVMKLTRLQPASQTWVEVVTQREGTILVEPNEQLYNSSMCLTGTGIADVTAGKPFHVLVANFGERPIDLRPQQVVAMAGSHPEKLVESDISHSEMLGIIPDNVDTKFRKRHVNVRDIDTINKHLSDQREQHMGEDEKPKTADEIDLNVPEDRKQEVRDMLRKHEKSWSGQLGDITVTEMRIDLKPDAKPFKSPPYRAGPKTRELEKAEIDKQLAAGVIEPAMSEWAAPVLFVPKKDGKLRFCIDYRRLNSMTVKDTYPLPRMDECIDSLGDAQYFTTLDAYSGYWQMRIRKQDRPKTAFVCHAGTFQCTRMPFGLTNAPACFQRALDLVLTKYKWKTCLVYLDDVIIFSKNLDDHIAHVDEILDTLSAAGVTLKVNKCHFFQKEVEYLGHMVKPGQLEIDRTNVESLRNARPPTNKTQLRSFLGLCNVYRRFIDDFTGLAHPLNQQLKKGTPESFELDATQLDSFNKLIERVCSPPVLALPKAGLPYSVDCDASDYGIGCALFQTHPDGERKPIGFWSRSLLPAEVNYSASERECLAVVWALKTLRPYLMYEKFVVYTDHAALHWLLTIDDPSGRLIRWRLRLAEYDFEVKYKKGKANTQADALSRLNTSAETILSDDNDDIPVFLLDLVNIELEENRDPDSVDFLDVQYAEQDELYAAMDDAASPEVHFEPITREELLQAQLRDEFCASIRRKLNEGGEMSFEINDDGILVRSGDKGEQIVVPHSLKQRILYINHHTLLAGHPGGRKLYYKIRKDFYWPALAVDCYATVRKCPHCARNRIKLRKNVEQLQLFPATEPLTSVCIDILGEFIKTQRRNEYLLVITDRYSKLTKTVPMKGISAAEVARHFVNSWVFNYGPPTELVADNGGCFTSKFFIDVCRIMSIKNNFTTTYHPQSNGQVERYNRTILAALRTYVADHPRDWDLYTDALTYAYNCQPHTSTSIAPFDLVLSKPPGPLALKPMPTNEEPQGDFKKKWKHWLQDTMSKTKEQLQKAQARYKKNYDKRLRKQSEVIREDDYVYLRVERKNPKDHRHKLAPVVEGPFRVTKATGNTATIERKDRSVEKVSRSRVVLAPRPPTNQEVQDILRPTKLSDSEGPTNEEGNLQDLPHSQTVEEEEPRRMKTRSQTKESDSETKVANTGPGPGGSVEVEKEENQKTEESDTEEFVIDSIVSHKVNKSRRHRYAKQGENLYRVRWYGFDSDDDTWEPIKHLPRSKVLSYCSRMGFETPKNINDAVDG